jgi:hypothetical protein
VDCTHTKAPGQEPIINNYCPSRNEDKPHSNPKQSKATDNKRVVVYVCVGERLFGEKESAQCFID